MTRIILKYIMMFILLVLAQAVVFNNLCLYNVAFPLVFIYFILRLPITLGINWVMTFSFLIGLTVDIFSDTQGVNALCCTLLSVVRKPTLGLYLSRDDEMSGTEPSIKSLGLVVYMKYLITLVLFYCILYFLIESFSLFNPLRMLTRIVASTLLTFFLILAIDSLTLRRHAKRL
ncbi:MAG: rod shape-determining protein MreD [Muribaculaceae bacterium]|nr:rod shape-determining protein MreD [Muribaculaceae bacterium]